MISRRAFGVSVLGSTVTIPFAIAQGKGTTVAAPSDPVSDHIFHEAVRGAKHLQAGQRSAETFDALANNFRLHGAHAKANHFDERLRQTLRRQIDRQGRNAVVDHAMNHDHHDLLHSLQLDSLDVETHDASRSKYEQAITVLLTSGLTPTLQQVALALEQTARSLAKNTAPNGVVRVQVPCTSARPMCESMKFLTAVICGIAATGQVEFAPACAILAVETATICFIAWLEGC